MINSKSTGFWCLLCLGQPLAWRTFWTYMRMYPTVVVTHLVLSLIQRAGNPPSHIEVPPAAHQASPWRLRPLRPLRPSRNAGRGRLGRGCGCLPPQSHRQRQPGAGAWWDWWGRKGISWILFLLLGEDVHADLWRDQRSNRLSNTKTLLGARNEIPLGDWPIKNTCSIM